MNGDTSIQLNIEIIEGNKSAAEPDSGKNHHLKKLQVLCPYFLPIRVRVWVKKVLVNVYSISCSNAFAKGIFSHMKQAWTPSKNLMSIETIAAEWKIRLSSNMKCEGFSSLAQSQPEMIKRDRSKQAKI